VLRTTATCLAAGVEARYDLTVCVQYLGLPVYPKTAVGIEHPNPCCSRVEGRGVYPMQDRLLEVFVRAFVRKRVVPLLDMLGVFAEFETNLRRERQLEGIAKAKAAGVYKGRPASIDAAQVRAMKAEGKGASEIAKALKIGRASVYRVLEAG
jgi:hypothetical protein